MSRFREQAGFTLVELLVVMVMTGIVGAATLSVIVTTSRSNQYGSELRTVMDDGRVSLDRVRKELRGGRRVLSGSTTYHLYWWNDRNQNGLQESDERIHYCMAELNSMVCPTSYIASSTKFQLIRWTDDDDGNNDGQPDAGTARVIARTLSQANVTQGVFTLHTATGGFILGLKDDGTLVPTASSGPPVTSTQVARLVYHLDVRAAAGPDELTMSATVRLRNVA